MQANTEAAKFAMVVGVVQPALAQEEFKALAAQAYQSVGLDFDKAFDAKEARFLLEDLHVTFDSAEQADRVTEALLEVGSESTRARREPADICFRVSIAGGDAHEAPLLAQSLAQNAAIIRASDDKAVSSEVFVTSSVYDALAPIRQDQYRASEKIGSITAHRRFSAGFQRCFVVSPIKSPNSDIRRRADYVYETFIKPACDSAEYRPVRGEMMIGQEIMEDVKAGLETNLLVVAYLGSPKPHWNPNVMIEVGYRLAIGLPLVALRDKPEDEKEEALPFDLKDLRCVDLPPEEGTDQKERQAIIKTITQRIVSSTRVDSVWQYPHPFASIDIPAEQRETGSRYVESSDGLEELFEFPGIAGSRLMTVIDHLTAKMPPVQAQAFLNEQDALMASILSGGSVFRGAEKKVEATIPIVFQDHKKFKGRAYLPVIVRHARVGKLYRFRIVYIDVTGATRKAEQGHYVCTLSQAKLLKTESSNDGAAANPIEE